MTDTSIEWTDKTWNPVAGCTVLSPGCTNCYAMRMAARLDAMGVAKYRGLTRKTGGRAKWTGDVRPDHAALEIPLHWTKPSMVFVNSMSDLFHEQVPDAFVAQVWDVMAKASKHTFQVLTKRPDRMASITRVLPLLKNVWLGTIVESSDYRSRLDDLRKVRAQVRFVSFEPLLGSVGLTDLSGIQWAIVGGESGPKARLMERLWVNEIHAACRAHGTAFFKQWGGRNKKASGRKIDGKIWSEYPRASQINVAKPSPVASAASFQRKIPSPMPNSIPSGSTTNRSSGGCCCMASSAPARSCSPRCSFPTA